MDGSLLRTQEVVLILVHKSHVLTLQKDFGDGWLSRGLLKKILTHSLILLQSLQLLFNKQLKCLRQLFSADLLQIIHHEVVRVGRRREFEFAFEAGDRLVEFHSRVLLADAC